MTTEHATLALGDRIRLTEKMGPFAGRTGVIAERILPSGKYRWIVRIDGIEQLLPVSDGEVEPAAIRARGEP